MTQLAPTIPNTDIATMARLIQPQQFELTEQTPPKPGADQVLVRLEGCGLCGSNLPVWEGGSWFKYPLAPGAPGHEGWGIVEAVGERVSDVCVGQRVACLSQHAFATHDVVDVRQLVSLPTSLASVPVPAEPLACAYNVISRCDIQPGERVAIVGIGFLGAILVQLAVAAGAEVTAISRRRYALEVAEQCGAKHLVPLAEFTDRPSSCSPEYPCVIEAIGSQQSLDIAGNLVAIRGRIVVAGYHQDGPRSVPMQQWNWKGIDIINAHERDPDVYMDGMRAAITALDQNTLRLDGLLTHQFPLSEINETFQVASERLPGFLKAIVTM